ncbi:hypothetical protein CEE39_02820 [bacterium (candidate division B38) B3_B38]|nr:MAG: hypothetical protein CEE39_02820 [bacterium (candidate division B38) B3_B38]
MTTSIKEKFLGCIVGTGVGDALGAPLEGSPPGQLLPGEGGRFYYRGFYPYPPGQYTDDTQMTLAIMRAILKEGKVDGRTIADEFVPLWQKGEIIGAGGSCTEAVFNLISGKVSWEEAGTPRGRAGNGTAMRASPIGLWNHDHPDRIVSDATTASIITHKDERSIAGAIAVATTVAYGLNHDAIDGEELIDLLASAASQVHSGFARAISQLPRWLKIDEGEAVREITHSGEPEIGPWGWGGGITPYVIPTVLICLYYFLRSPHSFLSNVVKVINVGGDTDTTGAIQGAMSGAFNGIGAIPEHLVEGLQDSQDIITLTEEFYQLKHKD